MNYREVKNPRESTWRPIIRFNGALLAGVTGQRPDPMGATEAAATVNAYLAKGYEVRTPKGYT